MQAYKGIALGKCAQPVGVNKDHELEFKMILSGEINLFIHNCSF